MLTDRMAYDVYGCLNQLEKNKNQANRQKTTEHRARKFKYSNMPHYQTQALPLIVVQR